ncbi:MAG: hypothetical protein AAF403_03610, partial [Pseudomonadota bacterium]
MVLQSAIDQRYKNSLSAKKRLHKNMQWLKQHDPMLYGRLCEDILNQSEGSKLVGTCKNDLNITLGHHSFYDKNAQFDNAQKFKKYQKHPKRYFLSPSQIRHYGMPTELDTTPCFRAFGTRMARFVSHLEPKIAQTHDLKEAGLMVVFGLGLGLHLEKLIKAYPFRHLVIIEEYLEFLSHAFHTTDFKKLDDLLRKRQGKISFIIGFSVRQTI